VNFFDEIEDIVIVDIFNKTFQWWRGKVFALNVTKTSALNEDVFYS